MGILERCLILKHSKKGILTQENLFKKDYRVRKTFRLTPFGMKIGKSLIFY